MATENNGDAYVRYTTKELLREIALKVDRIEENSAPRQDVEKRFDRVEAKLDDMKNSTEEDIRDILGRVTALETSRQQYLPQVEGLLATVTAHDRHLAELGGETQWKRWSIPIALSVLSIILGIVGIWVAYHTGQPSAFNL